MRHFVVGTAGHIDHGKSALVKALTGIDPDRLEEEKRRGMTIDLGFAHFDLPSGRRVGIVDVPGHERLIKNMLAGATGIDLVLLVIAADEGVMPQTREHLDILRFLPVRQGIVVLNKIDLVSDVEWLALLKDEVKTLVDGTFLQKAPVVEASARTGQGIPTLIQTMDRMLNGVSSRSVEAPVRLPIDRSFTMAGFGTVVTGTLWSGKVSTGETLEILPQGRTVRVRGIQSHGSAIDAGAAGSRVAVNLVGVEKEDIQRGDVLVTPGIFSSAELMDVRIQLLPGAPALTHLSRLRLYLGTEEAIGRVFLLDRQRLDPGQTAVAQVRLESLVIAAAGDPFVLRRYSPMTTIGGGEVLNAHAPRRRRAADSVRAIEESTSGLEARVDHALLTAGRVGTTAEELSHTLATAKGQIEDTLHEMGSAGRVALVRGRLFHERVAQEVAATVRGEVNSYHAVTPWRSGIPKEDLKTKAFPSGESRLYTHILERLLAAGELEDLGAFIRRRGFSPKMAPEDLRLREQMATTLKMGQFAPPSREDLAAGTAADRKTFDRLFRTLVDEGTVVEVGDDIVFHRDVLDDIKRIVAAEIKERGNVTVASLRDRLGTSRKFALTVLEYFDTIRLTRRIGDARILVSK